MSDTTTPNTLLARVIRVLFHEVSEFVTEFTQAPPNIEKILRVTKQFTSTRVSPSIKHVAVLATYIRQTAWREKDSPVQIVELRRECGEHWEATGDESAIRRADAIINILEDAAKGQKLEVRAGTYTA